MIVARITIFLIGLAIGIFFYSEFENKGDNAKIILVITIAIVAAFYFFFTSNDWIMTHLDSLVRELFDL